MIKTALAFIALAELTQAELAQLVQPDRDARRQQKTRHNLESACETL